MHHYNEQRLADIATASVPRQDIEEMRAQADSLHLVGKTRDENLFIAGVSKGAELAQDMLQELIRVNLGIMRSALGKIDERMLTVDDEAGLLALTEARTGIANEVNKQAGYLAEALSRAAEQFTGFDYETLMSERSMSDQPFAYILAAASKAFTLNARVFFGWHLVNSDKAKIKCRCGGCYARAFDGSVISHKEILDDVLRTYQSFDTALVEWASEFVDDYRTLLRTEFAPVAGDAKLDPGAATTAYDSLMDGLINGGKPNPGSHLG